MKQQVTAAVRDNEIVSRIIFEGASEKFSILYKKYHKKVYDKCLSFVKNKVIELELTNEIFSKTFEQLINFRQQCSFSSWLFTITYNHCIDYLRKQKQLHYPNWNKENEITDLIDDSEENMSDINYENLLVILEMIHPEEKAMLLMMWATPIVVVVIGIFNNWRHKEWWCRCRRH